MKKKMLVFMENTHTHTQKYFRPYPQERTCVCVCTCIHISSCIPAANSLIFSFMLSFLLLFLRRGSFFFPLPILLYVLSSHHAARSRCRYHFHLRTVLSKELLAMLLLRPLNLLLRALSFTTGRFDPQCSPPIPDEIFLSEFSGAPNLFVAASS